MTLDERKKSKALKAAHTKDLNREKKKLSDAMVWESRSMQQ